MRESQAKQSSESRRIRQALVTYIGSIPLSTMPPNIKLATRGLDLGEAEAVALAAVQGVPLLIDDAAGRKAALKVGIQVIGMVGVLLRAKQVGYIEQVSPILKNYKTRGTGSLMPCCSKRVYWRMNKMMWHPLVDVVDFIQVGTYVGWERHPSSGQWAWLETTVFLTNDFADACDLGRRKAVAFHQRREQTGDAAWHRLLSIQALRKHHHITPLE